MDPVEVEEKKTRMTLQTLLTPGFALGNSRAV